MIELASSNLFALFCLLRVCGVVNYSAAMTVGISHLTSVKSKQIDSLVNPDSCDVAGASNKRWVSSINFVNAAGLRAQDSAFVGLSNFPSFDRNHADEELGKLRFGFF
jgi:hypothetical protein